VIKTRVVGAAAVQAEVRRLGERITQVKREFADDLAVEMPKRLKRAVRRRVYPYAPNTASTLKSKHGHTPLIDEENYINSWQGRVITRPAGAGKFFEIAFAPTGINPARGIPNETLAIWLDRGTRAIPARPHIMPFMVDIQKFANAELRKRVSRVLRS